MINSQEYLEKTTFYPGSEWLYVKVYCSQSSLDNVISSLLQHVEEDIVLHTEMPISYFFVRYFDTDHHLRLRFKVDSPKRIGEILCKVNQVSYANQSIRKVTIDTYLREIERYKVNIDVIEKLFCIDSEIIFRFLSEEKDNFPSDVTRMGLALFEINHYLKSFNLSNEDILLFVKTAKNDFFLELNVDTLLKKKLNIKFKEIILLMKEQYLVIQHCSLREKRSELCLEIIEDKSFLLYKNEIIWSIIHMYINKLFNRNQRFYEMIAYDFAEKIFHKSSINTNNFLYK